MTTKDEDTDMIPLAEAAKLNNIPLRTLRSAVLAGRMWATKRGRDWYTIPSEIEHFKRTYTPHRIVKNL